MNRQSPNKFQQYLVPPQVSSPSRVISTSRAPVTPITGRLNVSNVSRMNHSPLISSHASQFLPHVPLLTEPSPGMQTILRPIAYEAVHIPIVETVQIQPTIKINSNVRTFSPQYIQQFSSVKSSIAPVSGNPSHKPNSVSTYMLPKHPNYQEQIPQQSQRDREIAQQNQNNQNNQNNYYSSKPLQPLPNNKRTLNRDTSVQNIQNIQTESDKKSQQQSDRFDTQQEDDFKKKVSELQQELIEKSHDQQQWQPMERTRHTENDSRKSDDLKREVNEMEDKIKVYKKESDTWKNKYQTQENEKRKALDDLQNQYEENMRNHLNSMNNTCNNKIQDLSHQIKELQQQLNDSTRDNEKWRRKCHEYELQQFEWKTKIVDSEAQRDSIQKDYDRLQTTFMRNKNELEQLKALNDVQMKKLPKEADIYRLQDLIEQREKEIDDLKNRNSQLEMLCIEIKKIDTLNHELSYQLQMSEQNSQMLRDQIEKKDRELNDERNKIKKLQDQNKDLQQSDSKNRSIREDELYQEIERLNYVINEKNTENMQYQQIVDDLKSQLQRLQSRMNQLKQEYEQEIDGLNDKKNGYEQEFRENMEKKFQLLKREIDSLQSERQNLLQELQKIQQDKVNAENTSSQLQQECEHVNHLLDQKSIDLQNTQHNRDRLNNQLDQAQRQINELNVELQDLKYRNNGNNGSTFENYNSNQNPKGGPGDTQRSSVSKYRYD